MVLTSISTLFPAIPLAIVALNFRYTSLAGLMRTLCAQIEAVDTHLSKRDILAAELGVLQKRMKLVKQSLFFSGIAFVCNLAALLCVSLSAQTAGFFFLALAILSLMFGLLHFCIETLLSTKALNLHISPLNN